jgi:hypothetical protein
MMVLLMTKNLCHALKKTARTFHIYGLFLILLNLTLHNLMPKKFMPWDIHRTQCSQLILDSVLMKRFLAFGKVVVVWLTLVNHPTCLDVKLM